VSSPVAGPRTDPESRDPAAEGREAGQPAARGPLPLDPRLPHTVLDFNLALVDVDPWAIHYSRYTEWMDRGLMQLLRQVGHPLSRIMSEGYAFPVVSCRLDCLTPVGLDDRLRLLTAVGRLGRTSLTMSYRFTRLRPDGSEVLAAYGETVHVCVDRAARRPRPLPEWLAEGSSHQTQS
jgi:YbgC/YbaW family acyl-CoA thioester hydrolase